MEWTDIKTTVPAVWAETAEAIATGISGGGIYIEDYRDLEAQVEAIAHVDLIEQELLDKNIQLAFIEGVPSQTDIHYIPFLKDEIVLVTSAKNDSPESITKEQLKTLKFVVREEGSGTYNIIQRQLSAAGMSINELNQQIVIGSTEGIKQYLKHSDCYALVSVFSIQDELSCGLLKIIDIDDLEISRTLYAIHKQGTIDPYAELLLRFCESRNRKSKR